MKKSLKPRKPKIALRPRMYVTVEKIRPVKGIKSIRPEVAIVPVSDTPLRLAERYNVPNTHVQIDKSTKRAVGIVTVMPDGTQVAWGSCGRCHSYYTLCKCKDGIHVGRSIEYIYDQTVAKMAGQDWGVNHPNYYGSTGKKDREARLSRSSVIATNVQPRTATPAKPADSPQDGRKRLRKAQDTPAPRKSLRKASSAPSDPPPWDVPDQATVDAAADRKAAALTKTLSKSLKSGGKKTLTKRR